MKEKSENVTPVSAEVTRIVIIICSFYSSSKERQNQTHINLGNIFNHVANKYEKGKKKKRTNYQDRNKELFRL